MLDGVAATSATTSLSPGFAGLTTPATVGHSPFSGSSPNSFHVKLPPSVLNAELLICPRKRLKICVEPLAPWSTIGCIGCELQPAPMSVSPPSVTSPQVLTEPLNTPLSVCRLSTTLPGAAVLVAVQPVGRCASTATAP